MDYQIESMRNGMKTLFVDWPDSNTACVQIWFRAGSALERGNDLGIAHFLEHMFFKGTPTRPNGQIAHQVESLGGELNAFTSFDCTCYLANTPNSHLTKVVDILMDMISNPRFKQNELLPERDVVFEEYRGSIDSPSQYSFYQVQKHCFSEGYAHPILGTEKTIKSFTRQQLIKFRKDFYNTANSMVLVAGNLKRNKEKLTRVIQKYKMPKGSTSKFPKLKLKDRPSVAVHQKDVNMCTLHLTTEACDLESPEAPAEDLAISCLGHGKSSRLYRQVVLADSLANSANASTMFMRKGGFHDIQSMFPYSNLSKVLSRLQETLSSALEQSFSSKEVEKIKAQYIASKVYESETLESFAFSLGHGYAQTGDVDSEQKYIERIRAVPTHKVHHALKEIFKRPLHISLQIPQTEEVKEAKSVIKEFTKDMQSLRSKIKTTSINKKNITKSKHDPKAVLVKLKKGISLVYRHNTLTPTFVLQAYINGGLCKESDNTNGHHGLLSKAIIGGYGVVSYDQLKEDLEHKSVSFNAFSGRNSYGLNIHGQSLYFEELMKHFQGSLMNPSLKDEVIDHEREMVLRRIDMQQKDPIRTCFREVGKIMFEGHPYSRNIAGTVESLDSANRDKLLNMHQEGLKRRNMLFTYCGDLDLEQVCNSINTVITDLPDREDASDKKLPARYKGPQSTTISFDREQSQIFIGVQTADMGHKENIYLKILTSHLAGLSSELFIITRDQQGLCYTARPIDFSAAYGGYWGIYMASGHDKVEAAIDTITSMINKIKSKGIGAGNFNKAKRMILGKEVLDLQSNEDYANLYSVPTLYGYSIDYHYKELKQIKDTTYQEFHDNIRKILSRPMATVTVGR